MFQVDLVTEQCLIKFGDDTESWSSFKGLTKLTLPESDLLCVICKKSQPKTDNDIIVCDKCGRGYHQLCHQVCICKGLLQQWLELWTVVLKIGLFLMLGISECRHVILCVTVSMCMTDQVLSSASRV